MKKYVLLFWVTIFILPFLGIRVSVGQNPLVKQWEKRICENVNDAYYAIKIISDGAYILGGNTFLGANGDKSQPSLGGEDYWSVKCTSWHLYSKSLYSQRCIHAKVIDSITRQITYSQF